MEAVLEILQESVVGGASKSHGHGGTDGMTILPLLWEDDDCRGAFRFLCLLAGDSLKLVLDFERAGRAPRFRIRLDGGVHAEEVTVDAADGEVRINNTALLVRASISSRELTVDLDLSGLPLDRPCRDDRGRSGYVGVAAEESGRIAACTVFPL